MSVLSALTLRRLLAIDAVSSGGMGLLLLAGGGALEGLLGIPAGFLRGAGATLIPFAILVGWLALRPAPPRAAVWLVVGLNALWALESLLVLAAGWIAPTALGLVFVLAQALFVGALAETQALSLRRRQAAVA